MPPREASGKLLRRSRRSLDEPLRERPADAPFSPIFHALPSGSGRVADRFRSSADAGAEALAAAIFDSDCSTEEILSHLAGSGRPSDLARLRRLAGTSLFSKADWAAFYALRSCAFAAILREQAEADRSSRGRAVLAHDDDRILAWMEQAKPAGFEPHDPLEGRAAQIFGGPEGKTSVKAFSDAQIRSAEMAAVPLREKFGDLEGRALEALSDGDLKAFESLTRRAVWTREPVRAAAGGRDFVLPKIFLRVVELDAGERRRALAILADSKSLSVDDWSNLWKWALHDAAASMRGPGEICNWMREARPRGFDPASPDAQGAFDDAFALAFRWRGHREASASGRPAASTRTAAPALARWLAAGAKTSRLGPRELVGLKQKLVEQFAETELQGDGASQAAKSLAISSLVEILRVEPPTPSDWSELARSLDRSLIRNHPNIKAARDAGLSTAPVYADHERAFASVSKLFLSASKASGRPFDGLAALAASPYGTASGQAVAARVSLSILDQADAASETFPAAVWIALLPHLESGEHRQRAREALRAAAKSGETWPYSAVGRLGESTIRAYERELLSGLDSCETAKALLDNARTRRGFSIPKILARAEAVGAWDDCAATVDGDGRDALFWLCKNASGPELLACAEPLLAHGSDPARMDRVGLSAVHFAAAAGQIPLVALMDRYRPGCAEERHQGSASAQEVAALCAVDLHSHGLAKRPLESFGHISDPADVEKLKSWLSAPNPVDHGWADGLARLPGLLSELRELGLRSPSGADNAAILDEALASGEDDFAFETAGILLDEEESYSAPGQFPRRQALRQKFEAALACHRWDSPEREIARLVGSGRERAASVAGEIRSAILSGDYASARESAAFLSKAFDALETRVPELSEVSRAASMLSRWARDEELAGGTVGVSPELKSANVDAAVSALDALQAQLKTSKGAGSAFALLAEQSRSRDWNGLRRKFSPLENSKLASFREFSALAASKIEPLLLSGAAAKTRNRMALVSSDAAALSEIVYHAEPRFEELGFTPIPSFSADSDPASPALDLPASGSNAAGPWRFKDGVWFSEICKAYAVSKIVDGQEVLYLSVRGTHWNDTENGYDHHDPEKKRQWDRMIYSDYARIWKHARRLMPLALAMQKLADERGAKLVLTGHSLGGAAVETLMQLMPKADMAFVFGSPGTGLALSKNPIVRAASKVASFFGASSASSDPAAARFSWKWLNWSAFSYRDPRVISLRHKGDGVTHIGGPLYSKTAAVEITSSLGPALEAESPSLIPLKAFGSLVQSFVGRIERFADDFRSADLFDKAKLLLNRSVGDVFAFSSLPARVPEFSIMVLNHCVDFGLKAVGRAFGVRHSMNQYTGSGEAAVRSYRKVLDADAKRLRLFTLMEDEGSKHLKGLLWDLEKTYKAPPLLDRAAPSTRIDPTVRLWAGALSRAWNAKDYQACVFLAEQAAPIWKDQNIPLAQMASFQSSASRCLSISNPEAVQTASDPLPADPLAVLQTLSKYGFKDAERPTEAEEEALNETSGRLFSKHIQAQNFFRVAPAGRRARALT